MQYPMCFKELNIRVLTDIEVTESNKFLSLVNCCDSILHAETRSCIMQ